MTYDKLTDDEIEVWTRRQRRNAALRVLGAGLFVLVPSLVWLIGYMNWEGTNAMITRTKVVGGVASSIGALLVIAGLVLLFKARQPPPDQIPRATARERQ